MKVNELQIGDWVMVRPFPDSEPVKSKITAINYNSYRGKDYTDWVDTDFWDELSLDQVEPIPLTPEILEKNGFRRTKRYNYIYKDNYCEVRVSFVPKIKIDDIDLGEPAVNVSINGALFDINMFMSSIHELQQTLRLCGIKKEIIL